MKKSLLILLTASACLLKAQFVNYCYDTDEFQAFLKIKTLYVMKTGHGQADSIMAESLKNYWKVTPYEMVNQAFVKKHSENPSYFFLMPTTFWVLWNNANIQNRFLAVIPGSPQKQSTRDMIAWAVIGNIVDEKYLIPDLVASLNKAIELVRDNKYKYKVSSDISMKFFLQNVYNPKLGRLKTKTLYIPKDLFGKKVPNISKVYPYKYKLVDRKDFAEIVENGGKDVAYTDLGYGWWGGLIVVDCETRETIGGIKIEKTIDIDEGDIADLIKAMKNAEGK